MRRLKPAILVLAVAGLLAGCEDTDKLNQQVGQLDQRLGNVEKQLEAAREELAAAAVQLQVAEAAKDAREKELEELRASNQSLHEEIDQLKGKVNQITAGELVPQYPAKSLVALLGHSDSSIRGSAMRILKQLADPECVDALIAVATSRADKDTRRNAILALTPFKDERVEEALIGLLDDPDESVRRATYEACGEVATGALLEPLLEAFEREVDRPMPTGRSYNSELQTLAKALGGFTDIKAGRALLKLLNDPNKYIRQYASSALRKYRNVEIVPEIVAFLKKADDPLPNDSSTSHYSLIQMLQQIGDPRGAEAVMSLLGSRNRRVREGAANALRNLARREHVPMLSEMLITAKATNGQGLQSSERGSIIRALGSLDDRRAAKALLSAVNSSDTSLVHSAATALANCPPDPEITADLIKAWETCKNNSAKRYLKQALSSGVYPVDWVEDDNAFVIDKERLERMLKQKDEGPGTPPAGVKPERAEQDIAF